MSLPPPFAQTFPLSPPSTPPLLALDTCGPLSAANSVASAPRRPTQHLKLSHESTTRLLALPHDELSFSAVAAAARALFALPPTSGVAALQSTDAEGDVLTLSSDAELDALRALTGGALLTLRLVVEEQEQEPAALRIEDSAVDHPAEVDGDDTDIGGAAFRREPSRGRGTGMGAPPAARREESLGRKLVRTLSRRLSRRSVRSERSAESGSDPAPPLPSPPSPSPALTARAPARPPLVTRASISALLHPPHHHHTPTSPALTPAPAASAPTPTPTPILQRRKSLAALADFLAPNRHVAPVSRPSAGAPLARCARVPGGSDGSHDAESEAPPPPPSYYSVVRMKEAQRARRLGRGLIGGCE
ncbi:hypothetical protein DMC30DRAFT_273547 [Rhodotorula diobovata]|uniref:PB1 domain-containing protein n=1 Tax=Rhodotorula diobovata TaxID=5288 RepID=A0A5C5FUQ2_9BASI|nr:hypothetical protein DMC30DRAFT_273547 [Rhodotorula diobovata]